MAITDILIDQESAQFRGTNTDTDNNVLTSVFLSKRDSYRASTFLLFT